MNISVILIIPFVGGAIAAGATAAGSAIALTAASAIGSATICGVSVATVAKVRDCYLCTVYYRI